MKFLKCRAGYRLLDNRINGDILEDLKANPVEKMLGQYKQKWLNHISRMEEIRCSKQLHGYWPIRRRSGKPLERLLDRYNHEAETGHLLV